MDKQAIEKTAVCYWSEEDHCYVVDSLIFQRCAGTGSTPEEARREFKAFLNEMYISYRDGKLAGYSKPGRPSKGAIGIHIRVQPTSKDTIDRLAKKFGISQGEVVDYLVNFHEIAVLPEKTRVQRISLGKARRRSGA